MKILVIRPDNIGDLVCTTPLLAQLRSHFPTATLAALVNSYNAPVLQGNPDVNAVYAYTKAKHRPPGEAWWRVYWTRYRMVRALRAARFDLAVLATPRFSPKALELARQARVASILGVVEPGAPAAARWVDRPVAPAASALHQVEQLQPLAAALGVAGPPPPVRVFPDPQAVAATGAWWPGAPNAGEPGWVGLHLSARKPSQRWSETHFAELVVALGAAGARGILLFWAPGPADHPQHPGDDEKAQAVLRALADLSDRLARLTLHGAQAPLPPVVPCPTQGLPALISGLSLCSSVICADGGAMHLAAGLGKPLVCLFGDSDAGVWYPWGVTHELIQPPSRHVRDISVAQVAAAHARVTGTGGGLTAGSVMPEVGA